jgi:hypothetical protein
MTDEPTTLDLLTLVVAIVGVCLAVLSLGWQAAVFFLSGSRVRLEPRRAMIRRSGPMGTMISTAPLARTDEQMDFLRRQGFTEEALAVVVRNRGRLAVSVDGVSLKSSDGWGYEMINDPENKPLPYRLEAGSKQSWHIPLEMAQDMADKNGKSFRVWMVVDLGDGRSLRTKRRYRRAGTFKLNPRRG